MFGDRLKKLRIEKNLSQDELGKICGVAKNTVSYWETNNTEPSIQIIIKLAQFFGVSTDYLLGIDSNKKEKLKIALKEAGMMVSEDLTIEEFEKALKIVKKKKKDTSN